MSEIRTNILISGESSEYRSNIEISVVTLNSALVDTHSSFRTNLDITTTLKDGSISAIKTNLELNNVALKFYLVDMTKLKQSLLYFSKFFNMYFEPEVMWDLLAQGTNEQINISHLNEALSNYVKVDITNNILTDLERIKLNLQEHIKDNKKHFTEKEKEFLLNLMENPNSFGSGDSLFEKISINQNNIILPAVKPLKQDGKDAGIISNTFISCRGIDSTASGGSGGITRIDLFNILSGEPISDSEFINNKFLKISPLIEDWIRHNLKNFETDPTVPDFIKKITEQQIESWDAVASWFDISEDKSYIFTTNERGFVSHNFISCKGLDYNAASSGGSFSRSELFDILSDNPQEGERINLQYLIGLEELVESFGFLKSINKNQITTALGYTPLKKEDFKDFATVSNIVKQDVDNWNFIFSLIGLSEDGTYIFPKENRGFVSNSFISCRGLDETAPQVAGTFDRSSLFEILSNEPQDGEFIDLRFLNLNDYASQDDLTILREDFEKLEEAVNPLFGYFDANGNANNALKLGGHSADYFATADAVNILADDVEMLKGYWYIDREGNLHTTHNIVVEGGGAFGMGAESGDVPSASVSIKFEGSNDIFSPVDGIITLPAYPSGGGGVADSVDWANVANKPTTLSGYGITDALSISGGTISGALKIGTQGELWYGSNGEPYLKNTTTGNYINVGISGLYWNNTNQFLTDANYYNYALPLSGGRIDGQFAIYNNTGPWSSTIEYGNTNGYLGSLGIRDTTKQPTFYDGTSYYDIIHSGNIGSYSGTIGAGDIVMNGNSVLSQSSATSELQLGGGIAKTATTAIYGTKVSLYTWGGGSTFYPLVLNNNGNVLIGTTSDGGARLQTKGHIDTYNDGDYSGVIGFNRKSTVGGLYNTSYHGWQLYNYKGNFRFYLEKTTGDAATPISIIGDNGNVGINTTNPQYELDVNGTLNATTIYQNGQTLDKYYLPLSGGTISSDVAGASLIINNASELSYIYFKVKNTSKASVGWYNGAAYLANEATSNAPRLVITDGGVPQYWDSHSGKNKYTLIHSGNIGSQSVNYASSAGNADTIDGYHANIMVKSYLDSTDNFTRFTDRAFFQTAWISGQGDFGSLVIPTWTGNRTESYYTTEIRFNNTSTSPNIRVTGPSGTSDWYTLARTVDNVASATKLQTVQYLWGQPFDGTNGVNGQISINFDSTSFYIEPSVGGTGMAGISWWRNVFTRGVIDAAPLCLNSVSGGNVLIGTTTDSGAKLQVDGDVKLKHIYISNSNDIYSDNGLWIQPYGGGEVNINALGTKTVINPSAGNVLIGKTSDNGAKLQVGGAIPNLISVKRTTNGGGAFIDYFANNASTRQWRVGASGEGHFIFENSSEVVLMSISSNGNVLMGTTNDRGGKLQVAEIIRIHSNSSGYSGMHFDLDTSSSTCWHLSARGPESNQPFRFYYFDGYNYNTRMDITTAGDLIVTGGGAFGSDIRYKNITSYRQLDLETIVNAPLFTFKWTDREDKVEHLGTSAQYWLDTQFKDAVNTANKDFFHLDYGALAVGIGISVAREVKGVKTEVEKLREELEQVKQELNYYKGIWHN